MNRALVLLYMDDYKYAEIADLIGISETNVSTRSNSTNCCLLISSIPYDDPTILPHIPIILQKYIWNLHVLLSSWAFLAAASRAWDNLLLHAWDGIFTSWWFSSAWECCQNEKWEATRRFRLRPVACFASWYAFIFAENRQAQCTGVFCLEGTLPPRPIILLPPLVCQNNTIS